MYFMYFHVFHDVFHDVFHHMFYYSLVAENFTLTTVWKRGCKESPQKTGEQEGEEKRSDGGLGQNGSAGGDEKGPTSRFADERHTRLETEENYHSLHFVTSKVS